MAGCWVPLLCDEIRERQSGVARETFEELPFSYYCNHKLTFERVGHVRSRARGEGGALCVIWLDYHRLMRRSFLRYIVRVYWVEHTTPERAACISYLKTLLSQEEDLRTLKAGSCRHDHRDDGSEKVLSSGKPNSESQDGSQCSRCEQPGMEPNCAGTNEDTEKLRDRDALTVRLQTYPRDLEDALIDEFPEIDCRPHGFSQSLYVVHVDGDYRCGVTSGSHMYLAPPDREKLAKDSISRASMKLEEALYVLGFDLRPEMTAIDVGASPGAWTQHLSKHVGRVVAVDPAPLHQNALQPNVTHLRMLAQEAIGKISQLCSVPSGIDLLVCDVNRHPVEASRIVLPLLPFVRSGGLLVLTLKFHGRGRDKELKIEEVKSVFQESLCNMDCIWLLGNSAYERTFVGRKV